MNANQSEAGPADVWLRKRTRVVTACLLALGLAACDTTNEQQSDSGSEPYSVEIHWDQWGIPHIYGESLEDTSYGFGWAQLRANSDLILDTIARARGKSAEYWGAEAEGQAYRWSAGTNLGSDLYVHTLGIPAMSEAWLAQSSPEVRAALTAYADGMNAYAASDASAISPEMKRVLPVTAADIVGHLHYLIYGRFIAGGDYARAIRWQIEQSAALAQPKAPLSVLSGEGSNAWAIGSDYTANGYPVLLQNPHLPWNGVTRFFEAHLVAPDLEIYGITMVGFPFIAMGVNEAGGWAHTNNPVDGADLYQVTLNGDDYLLDGEWLPVDQRTITLSVRQPSGSLERVERTVSSTRHGPLVAVNAAGSQALALRIAGFERGAIPDQYLEMARADTQTAFAAALSDLRMPMFNVLYANADGQTLYRYNTISPKRPAEKGVNWRGIIPGGRSDMIWDDLWEAGDLPAIENPETKWLQNANQPPWLAAVPALLQPADYPSDMVPAFGAISTPFREQQSIELLQSAKTGTFEELSGLTADTYLRSAPALLADLLGAASASKDPVLTEAIDILQRWDRRTDADSVGAVLYVEWVKALTASRGWSGLFAIPWTATDPTATPKGLSDPEAAVKALKDAVQAVSAAHGSLDVAWGDVYRLRQGERDLPASGGFDQLGAFDVLSFAPEGDGTYRAVGGTAYRSLTEFGPKLRAEAIMPYSNTLDQNSPYYGTQLALYASRKLRPVLFYRDDVLDGSVEQIRLTRPAHASKK